MTAHTTALTVLSQGRKRRRKREENPNKEAVITPISRVVKMVEECEPPMTIESYEVLNLMAIHKFEFTRKDGEFWFFV